MPTRQVHQGRGERRTRYYDWIGLPVHRASSFALSRVPGGRWTRCTSRCTREIATQLRNRGGYPLQRPAFQFWRRRAKYADMYRAPASMQMGTSKRCESWASISDGSRALDNWANRSWEE